MFFFEILFQQNHNLKQINSKEYKNDNDENDEEDNEEERVMGGI